MLKPEKSDFISARQVALDVLANLDVQKHDTSTRLDKLMDKTSERARATDLVFGIIRNLSALDLVLQKTADIKQGHTNKKILALLRIGAYELIYVPNTPEYAILNDAVDLASGVSKKSAGFVNAVLRNVQRAIQNREAKLAGQNPRRILPTTDKIGCVFNVDILPDPQQDLAAFFSQAFSLPSWLVRRWPTDFKPPQLKQICQASNRRPSVILWPNTLKISTNMLQERLQGENLEVLMSSDQSCVKLMQAVDISRLKSFQEGLFFIQDPAAAQAIGLLTLPKDCVLLDLCAAPGTKTAVAAIAMQNTGVIYATDADSKRLEKVSRNCQRLGIRNAEIIEPDDFEAFMSRNIAIDVIIADVPCSNTGVLARRVETRWRLDEKTLAGLAKIQGQILQKALTIVRPGGIVLYSTCSILRQENELLVQDVLKRTPAVSLLREQLILPAVETENGFDHDGGYAAVLQKN